MDGPQGVEIMRCAIPWEYQELGSTLLLHMARILKAAVAKGASRSPRRGSKTDRWRPNG
jgi:hypothetical protein